MSNWNGTLASKCWWPTTTNLGLCQLHENHALSKSPADTRGLTSTSSNLTPISRQFIFTVFTFGRKISNFRVLRNVVGLLLFRAFFFCVAVFWVCDLWNSLLC
mmetsp:Transcript_6429/g.12161  ORF Transcript_6429/g.12161 Transcript_6429/m.12161 type:complete len:103 (-) Transcript_6429:637-945(-)